MDLLDLLSKEKLGEAMWVDGNINDERLEKEEQPEMSDEYFSSILKQSEEDL